MIVDFIFYICDLPVVLSSKVVKFVIVNVLVSFCDCRLCDCLLCDYDHDLGLGFAICDLPSDHDWDWDLRFVICHLCDCWSVVLATAVKMPSLSIGSRKEHAERRLIDIVVGRHRRGRPIQSQPGTE